jgi:uncharacterized protein (TIGR03067 family)
MTKLVVILAVGLLFGADDKKADATKDQEKLQGDWTLQSGERDGEAFPEDLVKALKRNITGDKYVVTRDGETLAKGTFTLDAGQKLKTIDIKLEGVDKPVQGIYELEGDTFKLCYAAPGEARPKEFATKGGSGLTLAVWKKAKK